jgi:hypothetical protein
MGSYRDKKVVEGVFVRFSLRLRHSQHIITKPVFGKTCLMGSFCEKLVNFDIHAVDA